MSRIKPDWVGELLGQWASSDWRNAQLDLGFPDISPMFAKAVGTSFELDDVGGFSRSEVQTTIAAVEWLQQHHPEHWRALLREFRPWTRSTLQAHAVDSELVLEAGRMLEKYIDDALG
jgi:hypothetical protein